MTYTEIYNLICYKTWGDAPPPVAIATFLPGMIVRAHRKIQQDYNYWFMLASTTFDTVESQEAYTLPTDYKEFIELKQQIEGDTKYYPALTPVHPEYLRDRNRSLVESQYAEYFSLFNNLLLLSPIPSSIITNLMHYWKYLAFATTAGYTDELSQYGGMAIVNYVVFELKQDLDRPDVAQSYLQLFQDDIEQLKREDYHRRQAFIEDLEYHGV